MFFMITPEVLSVRFLTAAILFCYFGCLSLFQIELLYSHPHINPLDRL
jgi:hypothetical protein